MEQFSPHFDIAVVHSEVFRAVPADCYRAATQVDLFEAPLVRALLGIRALPRHIAGRLKVRPSATSARSTSPPTFRLKDLVGLGGILLGETPGVEMVLGQVSRPWRAVADPADAPTAPDGFTHFDKPGYAKITAGLRIDPYGNDSSILTIETRVALTDEESRRRFRRYWLLIGPFSSFIRRMALRLVATELDRGRPVVGRDIRNSAGPVRAQAGGEQSQQRDTQ
ncbi:hypothetical protein [Phycicoccus sp. Soil748]|uniref:hypothetical protein n=1 Tax=Phycicoccus sp. Soil748 TaxID=1736397 RepID=UPI0007031F54|nr:hypothetical protein [Phycicoccus sp. Soil748]KRE52562.1 hypothetical protein ASG70_14320 [Phycicoccus sp. Soil748]